MWSRQFYIFVGCLVVVLIRQSLITDIPDGENLFYFLLRDMSMGRGGSPLPIGITSAVVGSYCISGLLTSLIDRGVDRVVLALHTLILSSLLIMSLVGDRHFASTRWGTRGADAMSIAFVEGFNYAERTGVEVGTDSYVKLKKAGINTAFGVDNCLQLEDPNICRSWEVGLVVGAKKGFLIEQVGKGDDPKKKGGEDAK